jgi:hypothetical protein
MNTGIPLDLSGLKLELEGTWRSIPKPFRNEHAVRRTLQCRLYARLAEKGWCVVADYMPPRIADRPVDIVVIGKDQTLLYAFCIEPVVTLAAVKSLSSFDAEKKIIFTIGLLEKKVQESRFFLKPEIEHIHLQPFENSPYV